MRTLLCLLLIVCASAVQAQSLADSLIARLPAAPDDTSRLKLLGDIAWEFYGNDRNRALQYAGEAVSLARRMREPARLAQAYSDLAAMYGSFGDNGTALTHYQQALEIRDELGLEEKAAATRSNLAALYFRTGNIQQAIELQLQALRVLEARRMAVPLAQAYGNLANYYSEILDAPASRWYATRAYELSDSLNLTRMKAAALHSIAKSYEPEKRYRDMISALLGCLALYQSGEVRADMASIYGSLGNCYANLGIRDSAILYVRQAVSMSAAVQDTGRMAYSHVLQGHLLADGGDPAEAQRELEAGLRYARITGRRREMADAYRWLGKVYQQQGNPGKAYAALNNYISLQDTILSEAHQKEIARLQTQFETEKKEQQIALLSAENRNRSLQTRLALIAGLLVLLAAGVVIAGLVARQRARMREARLEAQRRGIEALIEGAESERRRLAAELHDGIAQQIGALRMAAQRLQTDLEAAAEPVKTLTRRISDSLLDAGDEVRAITRQLLPRTLDTVGLAPALEEMLSASLEPAGIRLDWQSDLPPTTERLPQAVELACFRIAQELVNNVLKHAEATVVTVRLHQRPDELYLHFSDNGKGMAPNAGDSASLGLVSMRTRAAHIGAVFQLTSQPGEGVRAEVRVPMG
ncbi:MAG: sensor histidine kinase [Bacteroidia bacterium]|nr:sensor histidine kinase [Bacteroidia bacterium]